MTVFDCLRCGHKWIPRYSTKLVEGKPRYCGKCKSPYWDREKSNVKKNCKKCGHIWISYLKGRDPKVCPVCRCRKWKTYV